MASSSQSVGDGGEEKKHTRPGLEVKRGRRKPRVQVGFAGATPKKQLILPAVDKDSACSTFVQFTPPRAQVSGPHEWDYDRVHALLGTGEIAHHMQVFTGFAELLFVACAQSAPPRDSGQSKKRGHEQPEKILVAVATTGWCWLLRGGLHLAAEVRHTKGNCCARPTAEKSTKRYLRSTTGWERVRQSFHVDELESISASDSVALPGCDLLTFEISDAAPVEISLDPEAAGLLLCHLRSLRALSDGLPYGGDSFSVRGEKAFRGVAHWAPPEPRSAEKAQFACLVTKLSALSQDWVRADGLGLSQLLDSGGDDSPTFRGTPKRLDVAVAETLTQIQASGRLDPDAECWKILPLHELAPSLGRGHPAFRTTALGTLDSAEPLQLLLPVATKVRTDLLEAHTVAVSSTPEPEPEQHSRIGLDLRLSMRKLSMNEMEDSSQIVHTIDFLDCKLDRMLFSHVAEEMPQLYRDGWTCDTCCKTHSSVTSVSPTGRRTSATVRKLCLALARHLALFDEIDAIERMPVEHEQCPAMLVVMEEARNAIRGITAQTGHSVVAEPFEVLPDSREADLAIESLQAELARSPTDTDLKVKLESAKQEAAHAKHQWADQRVSKEQLEWAMYAVMGPSEAQRCGASQLNVLYHGTASNTPAWLLRGDTRESWDICADCAADGAGTCEMMWHVRGMTDVALAREFDRSGATDTLRRTAVDAFELQAANMRAPASSGRMQ